MVAAMLGLLATACNKENELQQQDLTQTPITINANYGGSNSKVSYTESGNAINATWQSGDKLLVVYNNNVNTLDLTSGAGTANATFSGTITGTPADGATLVCYVKDQNTPSGTVTVSGDGSYIYTSDAFLSQDGTLAGAAKLNLYCGWTRYSSTSDINCTFSVNTSMMKFTVSEIDDDAGQTATLAYKSAGVEIAKTSFTVTTGDNLIYLTIPAGHYTGEQSLVFTCGETEKVEQLSLSQANFTAGQTYSKIITFMRYKPLTFEAKRAGSSVTFNSNGCSINLEYKKNGGPWTTYSGTITLSNIGDKVSFRGDNITFCYDLNHRGRFTINNECFIYGNIMSILFSTEYATATTLPGSLSGLFYNNSYIYNHPSKDLVLPATTLTERSCYFTMFQGCTNLTRAPELPATKLTEYCYAAMFMGCTGLTTAPKLPATELAGGCYSQMFQNCGYLTAAPLLPATTLAGSCYHRMFSGCTRLRSIILPATTLEPGCYQGMLGSCQSLTWVKCLATDISASYCTENWLSGVAASGTFIKAEAMNGWTTGTSGIPSGWTVENAQ